MPMLEADWKNYGNCQISRFTPVVRARVEAGMLTHANTHNQFIYNVVSVSENTGSIRDKLAV